MTTQLITAAWSKSMKPCKCEHWQVCSLCNPAIVRAMEEARMRKHDHVAASHAKRLALELECLLLETKDTAALSKWWDTAMDALNNYHTALQEVEVKP